MPDTAARLLVVGPSWVGDMVMSQVLYRHLQQRRPGLQLDVLAPAWSAPILQRMPEVNQAIALPFGHGEVKLVERRQLGVRLRAAAYQQAIVLPNSLKSALVPFFANIPLRTGWRGEMRYGLLNDLRLLDKQALPLMVQRFAALGMPARASLPEVLPVPCLQVDAVAARQAAEKFSLDAGQPLLALCPGAEFGAAKRWPAEYFAELARRYLQRGWQVALFGSDNDRSVCAQISEAHNGCTDLAGRTSLAEALDLLSLASAVVSNDSGLMHIAAALQRPLVAIYGPTSPGFTPPQGTRAALQVSDIDCAPCFKRECPLGHHRCMRDMSPQAVVDGLEAVLLESG